MISVKYHITDTIVSIDSDSASNILPYDLSKLSRFLKRRKWPRIDVVFLRFCQFLTPRLFNFLTYKISFKYRGL